MGVSRRILCLANSSKPSGRCVAGREITPTGVGPWIRPVSKRPSEEISLQEQQYPDRTMPQLTDVIELSLTQHKPHACQTENWVIDSSVTWKRVRRATFAELEACVECPDALWINGHSTQAGLNDEIPQVLADTLPRSLFLIRVDELTLRSVDSLHSPKKKVLVQFNHSGSYYQLSLTDPAAKEAFLASRIGQRTIRDCFLTVSLGEPFTKSTGGSYRYKLVAGLIERSAIRAHDGQ